MEWIPLDQAEILRQMMSGSETSKMGVMALLATTGAKNTHHFLQNVANHYYKANYERVLLLGIDKGFSGIERYLNEDIEVENVKRSISRGIEVIEGSLDILQRIKGNKYKKEKMLDLIQKSEENADLVLYYAGEGLNVNSINLSVMSNRVLLISSPNEQSLNEVIKYCRFIEKMSIDLDIGLVVDTDNPQTYEEHLNKIQELGGSQINYYIEPLGFMDFKYLPLYNQNELFHSFKIDFLNYKGKRSLSEILSERL
jgi:hypothetical protein